MKGARHSLTSLHTNHAFVPIKKILLGAFFSVLKILYLVPPIMGLSLHPIIMSCFFFHLADYVNFHFNMVEELVMHNLKTK